MKDTLIIHPEDESTSFLKQIYSNRKNVLVVSGNVTKLALLNMVLEHDRVIMMGYGSPDGLVILNISVAPECLKHYNGWSLFRYA